MELRVRLLTAAGLLSVVGACMYFGGYPLLILTTAVFFQGLKEYFDVVCSEGRSVFLSLFLVLGTLVLALYSQVPQLMLAVICARYFFAFDIVKAWISKKEIQRQTHFSTFDNFYYFVIIPFFTILPIYYILTAVIYEKISHPEYSFYTNYFLFIYYSLFCVIVFDSGSYFTGRKFGKNKIAKNISPKKTIEGFIGGNLSLILVCLLYLVCVQKLNYDKPKEIGGVVLISLIVGYLAFVGDLFFSKLKRTFQIKDFSAIFPGHGGVFDRIDSYLFVVGGLYCLFTFLDIFLPA